MARSCVRRISGRSSADPHAALAEEWIVFLRNRQVSERLVAADIERADDERMLCADRLGDRFVSLELLVLGRRACCVP